MDLIFFTIIAIIIVVSNSSYVRNQIAKEIESYASMDKYKDKSDIILEIARNVKFKNKPQNTQAKNNTQITSQLPIDNKKPEDITVSEMLATRQNTVEKTDDKVTVEEKSFAVQQQSAPSDPKIKNNPFESLGNINLLLYLGAFMIVVSTTILVSANLQQIPGILKMLLVVLFTVGFYGVGMSLYLKVKKLKPAGITFTMIGLLLAPFVGVAYRNFINLNLSVSVIWLLTSIFLVLVYSITFKITRWKNLTYAILLMILSSTESLVYTLDRGVHWHIWIAMMTATAFLISKKITSEHSQNIITIISNTIVGASVFGVFLQLFYGGWEAAVTLVLLSVFIVCEFSLSSKKTTSNYIMVILAVLGIWWISLGNFVNDFTLGMLPIGYWLLSYSVILQLISVFFHKNQNPLYKNIARYVGYFGAVTSLSALIFFFGEPTTMILCIFILLLISVSTISLWRTRDIVYASFISVYAFVLAPAYFIGWQKLEYKDWMMTISIFYLLVAALATVIRLVTKNKALLSQDNSQEIAKTTPEYSVVLSKNYWQIFLRSNTWFFLVIGWLLSLPTTFWFSVLASIIFSACLILVANSKQKLWPLVLVTVFVNLIIFSKIINKFDLGQNEYLVIYSISAVAYMLVTQLYKKFTLHGLCLTYSSLFMAFLAWVVSFYGTQDWLVLVSSILNAGLWLSFGLINKKYWWSIIPSVLFVYIGLLTIPRFVEGFESVTIITFSFTVWGSIVFAVGYLLKNLKNHSLVLRIMGLSGVVVAILMGNYYINILATVLLAGLIFLESRSRKTPISKTYFVYMGLAVVNLAINRYFGKINIDELQVYTLSWSALLYYLSYNEWTNKREHKSDLFLMSGLSLTTIPLAFQVILDPSVAWRSLMLVFESVGFLIVGIAIRKKMLWLWGSVSLVCQVIYQMRNYIFGLSKFIIGIILGVGLIVVAIYFLLKRDNSENNKNNT